MYLKMQACDLNLFYKKEHISGHIKIASRNICRYYERCRNKFLFRLYLLQRAHQRVGAYNMWRHVIKRVAGYGRLLAAAFLSSAVKCATYTTQNYSCKCGIYGGARMARGWRMVRTSNVRVLTIICVTRTYVLSSIPWQSMRFIRYEVGFLHPHTFLTVSDTMKETKDAVKNIILC